jgi:hypothetical protein
VNDLTRYEQELANQLNDPPLPDENQAWQDMEKMLDRNNNKGGGKKPPFNRGMWGTALGILLLTIGILWLAQYKKQLLLKDEDNKVRTITDQTSSIKTTDTKETTETTPVINNNTIHSNATKTGSTPLPEDKGTTNSSATIKNEENTTGESNVAHTDHLSAGNKTNITQSSEANISSSNNTAQLNDVADKNNTIAGNHFIAGTKLSGSHYKKGTHKSIHLLSNKNDVVDNTSAKNTKRISNEDEDNSTPIEQTDNTNTAARSLNKKHSYRSSLYTTGSKGSSINKNYPNNSESTDEDVNTSNINGRAHGKGKLILNKSKDPNYHVKHFGATDNETSSTDIASSTTDNSDVKTTKDTTTIQHIAPKQTTIDTASFKPLTTTIKKPLDTTKSDTTGKDKKEDKKKKKSYFAAGIAAQQSVDKSCNCSYPNNMNAPAAVKDYIPSAYLGYYTRKWFLQSAFEYAAPQYVNGLTYHVIQDVPLAVNDTSTTFTIKKTYSQQGSVSFNYYILPNLSIGTGLIYNIFSGADIQKIVQKKSYGPTDSLISSTMITDKDDTGFNGLGKSNFQLLLEAQYQWKRFSFGARYAVGLTPYIKYTDPYSGTPAQKENNSFNIFVRYDLWKQK